MLIAGHRGASAHAPENTRASFRQSLACGAEAVELDVHRCKSGEMVVMHDHDVSRTTNGSGHIKDLTLAELKTLELANGERIQTLDETLADLQHRCKDGQCPTVFIEVKSPGAKQVAASIRRAVDTLGYRYDQLPVIGFNPKQVGLVKAFHQKIEVGLSIAANFPLRDSGKLILMAKAMRASAINPEHTLVTTELVEKAHAAGLKVNTWTVNDHEDMRRVMKTGVDTVMTDYPERATRLAQALRPDMYETSRGM